MRISDDRYSRDRDRLDVALRFIRLEARTHTIRHWTGLSDDRIRKLFHSYAREAGHGKLVRHRGKSPQQAAFFMRSARIRPHAAALASLWRILGALPDPLPVVTGPNAQSSPGPGRGPARGSGRGSGRGANGAPAAARALLTLARAELLCDAYEVYCSQVLAPLISFEHAVFLLETLWHGQELALGACRDCNALLVVDRWSIQVNRCALCTLQAPEAAAQLPLALASELAIPAA